MTEGEWALFTAEVEATFRGDLAEDREAALREHFLLVPFDTARECVGYLVRTARQVWVPTPAELVNALESVVGGNGWQFRCMLNGRTEAEQRALDSAELQRRLEGGASPDSWRRPRLGAG